MSEDTAVDSTIDLKKRARRRLVGAAALALLAVIVLPLVMDSEPKPSGQEIQIRIPSQDNDSVVTRVLPVKPAPVTLPSVNAGDSGGKVSLSATAVAPVEAVKPKAEAPAAKTEPAKKAEVVHAEAALAGKESGQWIVQLGAYQNAANVKQLTAKLKDMGLASYTEKLDSPQGSRTRVRAGPFSSQEAADKARLKIKKIGIDGPVVQK